MTTVLMAAREIAAWVDATWRRGIEPEPQLTVSDWADRHRMLPPTSSEPGPWDTDRVPYLRGIMDALSASSPIERVIFMKGAQVGGTEAGLNWLGYVIAHAPGTMLMVQPSLDAIRRNTPLRIDPLIEHTPILRGLVVERKSRETGNSLFRKAFPGGELIMTTASSGIGLRSTPARFLFMDEVDAYPASVDDEGDPVALAIQRTVTFRGRRKVYLVSTPTLKGFSRIESAYLESDQRRFHVPCPSCGVLAPIEWCQIEWPAGRRDQAVRRCPHCRETHEERAKPAMLAGGCWLPGSPGDGRSAGFHLSALYSPFETWGEIAVEHGRVHRDPARLQSWTNNKLGETFEDRSGETVEPSAIRERAERWDRHLPAGVTVLTAAVDVQSDRLELEICGWGRDEESWSIDYRQVHGSPAGLPVWQELDELLCQTFPHALAVPDLRITACCIDSGGHHTGMVYGFVRTRAERRVWAVKGHHMPAKPIWPRSPSRENKGRVPLYMVGTDTAKDAIYNRLKIGEPGPGYMHFPADRPDTYFAGLTAERVRTKWVKGRPVREWIKHRDRNEPLDLKVYNLAALHGLIALGFNLNREAEQLARHPPRDSGAPPPERKRRAPVVARFSLE